jgi:hypothetical protein
MSQICIPSNFNDGLIGSLKLAYFINTKTPTFNNFFPSRFLKRSIGCCPIISHVTHWERIAFTRPLRGLNFGSDSTNCKKLILLDNKSALLESLTVQSHIKSFSVLDMSAQHAPSSLTTGENDFPVSNSYAHYSRAQFNWRKIRCVIQFPRDVFAPVARGYEFFIFDHSTIIPSKSLHIVNRGNRTKLFRIKKVYIRICRLSDKFWCG